MKQFWENSGFSVFRERSIALVSFSNSTHQKQLTPIHRLQFVQIGNFVEK